ncbi:hypothetical protein Asal01_01439 [Fodinibius salicampi]
MKPHYYKFLKETDLDVIEANNSLLSIDRESSHCITFLKSDNYHPLFEKYSTTIASKLDLAIGDKLYIVQLWIPAQTSVKKSDRLSWEEAYMISEDLDMFSVMILGYWKLIKKDKFSIFQSI